MTRGQRVDATCRICGEPFAYLYRSGPPRTQCAAHLNRTRTERGLGADHMKRRRRLLQDAYGTQCPLCGVIMESWHALDLDHSVPLALGGSVGDRITHSLCNRRRGGQLGVALRRALPTSRAW